MLNASQMQYARYAFIAACMAVVEGYYTGLSNPQVRPFRNNNPGDMEGYTGCIYPKRNGPFIVYPSKVLGFTDLVHDVSVNAGKPFREFIAKFAPPNENNTSEYLENVCTLTGIGPDDIL
jgi:hypothetical protein